MRIRHFTIKVFKPGNKTAFTRTFHAPRRKVFTQAGIDAALKQVADNLERMQPLEEYSLKELSGGRQFNFVHVGTKPAEEVA